MRALILAALFLAAITPVSARLRKPTPQQVLIDYASIVHNLPGGETIGIGWLASPPQPRPAAV